MRRTCARLTLGLAVLALLSVIASCIPPDWRLSKERFRVNWKWKEELFGKINPTPPPATFTVINECRLMDSAGNDVQKIYVYEGQFVEWRNESTADVVIDFNSADVTDDVKLLAPVGPNYEPTSFTTTIRSTMESDGQYTVRVICMRGKSTVYGPTPPIEECPPFPSPCP